MLPVYLKLQASEMKSPMQFDVVLGSVNALQVLMSTDDKFPCEDGKQYQKETLLFKCMLLSHGAKKDQNQKKQQKNSNLIIEASAAFVN